FQRSTAVLGDLHFCTNTCNGENLRWQYLCFSSQSRLADLRAGEARNETSRDQYDHEPSADSIQETIHTPISILNVLPHDRLSRTLSVQLADRKARQVFGQGSYRLFRLGGLR